MGLFSLKKTIKVSSTLYNLAGEENERNNYLKSTVIGHTLNSYSSGQSLTEDLVNSYLNGPGINFRRYSDWCKSSGYNDMLGMLGGKLYLNAEINIDVLASQIPAPEGSSVILQSSEIGFADFSWWADQYIADNYPDRINSNYEVAMDQVSTTISITWEDGSVSSFAPEGFDDNGEYIYASYFLSYDDVTGPMAAGVPILLDPEEGFLPTAGWSVVSGSSVNTPVDLTTTVNTLVEYSDSRPSESDTTLSTATDSFFTIDAQYHKSDFQGSSSSGSSLLLTTINSYRFDYQTGNVTTGSPAISTISETLPDGVLKTTTTTITPEVIEIAKGYRIDSQEVVGGSSSLKIFIYGKGSGNTVLDEMFQATQSSGEYFPPVPVRVDNDMIDDDRFAEYFDQISKAYKKATRSKFDKLLDSVKDNKSLGDIDYGYCSFGVPLNVKDKKSRKYIFAFFEQILEAIGNDPAYEKFKADLAEAQESQNEYNAWLEAQSNPRDPLYGKPAPKLISTPPLPVSSLQVRTSNIFNYNMIVSWSGLSQYSGSGILDPAYKSGDVWITFGDDLFYDQVIVNGSNSATTNSLTVEHMIINYQETASKWRSINVWGAKHKNKIYKGYAVDTSAKSAINDSEDSGFLIPLQKELYKSISVVDATQMSLACAYMVFNSYTVTKQKWYQSAVFQIIVIVAIIVVSVFFPPTAGLLGPAAALGATVGLSGVAAIIAGTVANMVASMVLMSVIGKVSTAVFGDKIGAIVGPILSVIAIAVGTSVSSGLSMTQTLNNLTEAKNLIGLTDSVGHGFAGYMKASAMETMQKTQAMLLEYSKKMAEISAANDELYGVGGEAFIDPLLFTDSSDSDSGESYESFMKRTLMTGNDIANLTLAIVENFANITTDSNLSMG